MMIITNNEWDLFLTVRAQVDAGVPAPSFDIVSPPLWGILTRRPARVRGADGALYDIGPDFVNVLEAFIKVGVDTSLVNAPTEYRLHFRPGKHHPLFDPAAVPPVADLGDGLTFTSTSPDALQSLLDQLPPGAAPTPGPVPTDDNGSR